MFSITTHISRSIADLGQTLGFPFPFFLPLTLISQGSLCKHQGFLFLSSSLSPNQESPSISLSLSMLFCRYTVLSKPLSSFKKQNKDQGFCLQSKILGFSFSFLPFFSLYIELGYLQESRSHVERANVKKMRSIDTIFSSLVAQSLHFY